MGGRVGGLGGRMGGVNDSDSQTACHLQLSSLLIAFGSEYCLRPDNLLNSVPARGTRVLHWFAVRAPTALLGFVLFWSYVSLSDLSRLV